MASWQPVMTPLKIIVLFLAVGVCFIPTGTSIVKSTNSVSLVNQHKKSDFGVPPNKIESYKPQLVAL